MVRFFVVAQDNKELIEQLKKQIEGLRTLQFTTKAHSLEEKVVRKQLIAQTQARLAFRIVKQMATLTMLRKDKEEFVKARFLIKDAKRLIKQQKAEAQLRQPQDDDTETPQSPEL